MPESFLALHALLDLLDHLLRAHHVGQLGDDDALARGRDVLDARGRRGCGTRRGRCGRRRGCRPGPTILPPVGRSGPGTNRMRSSSVASGCAIRCRAAAIDLDEVVRRHVGRHADGDAGRAVDQQVRDRGGQHLGLGAACCRSSGRSRRRPRRAPSSSPAPPAPGGPRCTGGRPGRRRASRSCRGRRPAAGAARTAGPGGPARRRSRCRRAGGSLPITSPTTRADFTCARSGRRPISRHLVEDAALHRLEAVAGVGQGPRVDDRVGVLEERALHLRGDVDVDDLLGGSRSRRAAATACAPWFVGLLDSGADRTGQTVPRATPTPVAPRWTSCEVTR